MPSLDKQWLLGITILLFAAQVSAQGAASGLVTIANAPNFSVQRECAQEVYEFLPNNMGCNSPVMNQCYCNPDITSSALYLISTKVAVDCSENAGDISTALSIYSLYCGVTPQATVFASVPATATTTEPGGVNAAASTGARVSPATGTSAAPAGGSGTSSDSSFPLSGGLSGGMEAAIAIAGLGVAIFSAWIAYKTYLWMKWH